MISTSKIVAVFLAAMIIFGIGADLLPLFLIGFLGTALMNISGYFSCRVSRQAILEQIPEIIADIKKETVDNETIWAACQVGLTVGVLLVFDAPFTAGAIILNSLACILTMREMLIVKEMNENNN